MEEDEFDEEIDDEEEEMEEDSSEGESEPPESDEDTYVKSERKLKRVKCSFLDDEAEDEDDIGQNNVNGDDAKESKQNAEEDKDNEDDDFHLSLADDEDDDDDDNVNLDLVKPNAKLQDTPCLESGNWGVQGFLFLIGFLKRV